MALLVTTVTPQARSIGKEFIPPEHWTYPALKRFETLGLVLLPSDALFTRPDVIGYVEEILKNIEDEEVTVTARDRFNLDRLEKEYSSIEAQENPKSRFDPPVIYATEEPIYLEGDVALSLNPVKPLLDPKWAFFVTGNPALRLHFGDWVTWEVRYLLAYGPERDDRVDKGKPSRRTKSWRGLTALYERAYLNYEWQRRITLFWGRDYTNWGPSENGNLLIADTAGSLDKWGGRVRFKNILFSFLNATLSPSADRRLAAHRLEFTWGRAVLGVNEAVVYAGRGFDPIYLLPLSSFYSNQYSEAGQDNVMWSFDGKWSATRNLLLYGSFLIDDFQFETGEPFPNKLAFDVGGRIALSNPLTATFRFQYRYVDIYTYTHMDSATYWVTGEVDLTLDNPLGALQGPDSDTAFLNMELYPIPSLTTTLSLTLQRRGEGNDYRMFQPGDPTNPPFPSGVVERIAGVGLGIEWELPRNSSVGARVVQAHVDNLNHIDGVSEWTTSVFMHLTWNL